MDDLLLRLVLKLSALVMVPLAVKIRFRPFLVLIFLSLTYEFGKYCQLAHMGPLFVRGHLRDFGIAADIIVFCLFVCSQFVRGGCQVRKRTVFWITSAYMVGVVIFELAQYCNLQLPRFTVSGIPVFKPQLSDPLALVDIAVEMVGFAIALVLTHWTIRGDSSELVPALKSKKFTLNVG